jgi:16S rRNA (guanine966-N2)-methyltransferase
LRIISGSARGRRLLSPKNFRIRPTADRVKESLFNILTVLMGSFEQCRALDIFAGTGNLGIEALSRGASYAVFVDIHKDSVALIKNNLRVCGVDERARIINAEAVAGLGFLEKGEAPFQLVFIDPPYRKSHAERTLEYLAASSLIGEDSLVVVEISSDEVLPSEFGSLKEFDRRVYGDTVIVLFQLQNKMN